MSMHESCLLVCRPCFNTMKSWKFDPNLHFSLTNTTSCLLSRLFACFLISLLAMSIMLVCFMPLSYALCIFSFHCLFAGSCLCLYMYIHGARMHGTRAWSPRHKQKGQRCEHVDISQAAMFSSFRGLASPIWLCTLLKPFPSSFLSLLDGLY